MPKGERTVLVVVTGQFPDRGQRLSGAGEDVSASVAMTSHEWHSFCDNDEETLEALAVEGHASICISDPEIEEMEWSESVVFRFGNGTIDSSSW